MSSKQLKSILSQIPSATAQGEKEYFKEELPKEIIGTIKSEKSLEELDRIVAQVPKVLKEEIKHYVKSHKGETERTVVLKALKIMGFNVPNNWLIDKRSFR
jgi:stalled ribosome rescue protein Dom34